MSRREQLDERGRGRSDSAEKPRSTAESQAPGTRTAPVAQAGQACWITSARPGQYTYTHKRTRHGVKRITESDRRLGRPTVCTQASVDISSPRRPLQTAEISKRPALPHLMSPRSSRPAACTLLVTEELQVMAPSRPFRQTFRLLTCPGSDNFCHPIYARDLPSALLADIGTDPTALSDPLLHQDRNPEKELLTISQRLATSIWYMTCGGCGWSRGRCSNVLAA